MILGVTLARGGSKGIPKKNIAMCAGKPLIAWTIEAAKKSWSLDKYVVSTDDDEIIEVVKQCGANVVQRPDHLAGDEVNRWDVLKDLVRLFPEAEHIVLLQATSPLRAYGRIDECIGVYKTGRYDSLATGYYFYDQQYPDNRGKNRQLMKPRFFDDGNVYIWSRSLIENNQYQEAGETPCLFETDPAEHIDINNPFDLFLAELVLNANPFRPTE